jgi:Domain of unknown function (DUF6531)/DSBA-like thioredoxin domain
VLADGVYYVLLNATDSTGKTMGSGIWLNVVGDYKPGRVTTTVTDLVVPAPGLPIQISRTYDSLVRAASSDFGYGWSLGIKVQLEIANTQDVTLTLNGQRRTFYFTPQSQGALGFLYLPQYTPEPGLFGTRDDLIAKATQLKLDVPRFTKDLDSHRFKPAVEADRQEGNRLGVDGTPFFFINGHAISGGVPLADFKKLIDTALKESAPAATPVPAR